MVVALGPGKFYGSSLPRPRFYTDVKLNDERVDPPVSVIDPFLSWADEAHWSMGGLSFKRLRLQGRIEGNVEKLRKERETTLKKRSQSVSPIKSPAPTVEKILPASPPLPAAPLAKKRRKLTLLVDEDEEDQAVADAGAVKSGIRKLARKLGDDFEEIEVVQKTQSKERENVASRTRGRRSGSESESTLRDSKKRKKMELSEAEVKKPVSADRKRSSPRLLNKGSN